MATFKLCTVLLLCGIALVSCQIVEYTSPQLGININTLGLYTPGPYLATVNQVCNGTSPNKTCTTYYYESAPVEFIVHNEVVVAPAVTGNYSYEYTGFVSTKRNTKLQNHASARREKREDVSNTVSITYWSPYYFETVVTIAFRPSDNAVFVVTTTALYSGLWADSFTNLTGCTGLSASIAWSSSFSHLPEDLHLVSSTGSHYIVDLTSGVCTPQTPIEETAEIAAISYAVEPNGYDQLFAMDRVTNSFGTLDPVTGKFTVITPLVDATTLSASNQLYLAVTFVNQSEPLVFLADKSVASLNLATGQFSDPSQMQLMGFAIRNSLLTPTPLASATSPVYPPSIPTSTPTSASTIAPTIAPTTAPISDPTSDPISTNAPSAPTSPSDAPTADPNPPNKAATSSAVTVFAGMGGVFFAALILL